MHSLPQAYGFLSEVTADGWISFIGAIVGAFITAVSILVAISQGRKQIKQQKAAALIPYYDALLQSLPSYDALITQADYLDDADALLGGFTSSEGKLRILEQALSDADERDKGILEHKIEKQKEYLAYWSKADEKIENFMNDGYFNAIKSVGNGAVIAAYYDFIVAFRNEHNYSGPVIDTRLLRSKLTRLMKAIDRAKE